MTYKTTVRLISAAVVFVVIISTIAAICDKAKEQKRAHQTYAVWCKIHPEIKLSFEEFQTARDANLLTP